MPICALCGKEKELRESHIIPKFVFKWLKKTSATGYIRAVLNPNLRKQDGIKHKLLCGNCENKFSKYEKYVADNIFYPYVDKKQQSFDYNNKLRLFIISVSWRILKCNLDNFIKDQPKLKEEVTKAEKYWRDILNKEKNDEIYQHHIFFLNYVEKSDVILPTFFQSYLMRSSDGTIVFAGKQVYIFFKFPEMMFISSIYPKDLSKWWKSSEIKENGIIGISQTIEHPGFASFLDSRVSLAEKNKISARQLQRIAKSMLENPERTLKSKSYELHLEEKKIKKK